MATSYLFGEQFRNLRGLTVDQALTGHGVRASTREVRSPEEEEEYDNHFRQSDEAPWRERIAETMSEHTPMPKILRKWTEDSSLFLVGNIYEVARDLRDLTHEMGTAGRVNENTLYRGARNAPIEDVVGHNALSFTEDQYVARSFAARGGKIWKQPAGTVRGLYIPDYVERQRTVGSGRRPEREWLIDPDSIIGRS